jgi:hypothetical protein
MENESFDKKSEDQPALPETQPVVQIDLTPEFQTIESVTPDPDDTPLEEVKASLRIALAESKAGQRIPIAQMWEDSDQAI